MYLVTQTFKKFR